MAVDERTRRAATAAQMYYQSGHSAEEIARHLHVSRSTVSRLLSHARETGIVEIRVRTDFNVNTRLHTALQQSLPHVKFHLVDVRQSLSENRIHDAVARRAADVVTELVEPGTRVGLAWGNTISRVVGHLGKNPVPDVSVVQLNGAGSHSDLGVSYAADIVTRFAESFLATDHLFPVPAFFDHPETKQALWRERSIQTILAHQQSANLLLFSIGGLAGDTVSYVYSAGYLTPAEVTSLQKEGVIGDIATTFFTEEGEGDLRINQRSTGPGLDLYRRSTRSICVVTGAAKVQSLAAALRLRYATDVVVDAPTAQRLLKYLRSPSTGRATARPVTIRR